MDLSTLLCRLGPVTAAEASAKVQALRFAHAQWLDIEPEVDFLGFVKRTPSTVLGQVFGSAGHDYYATTLLSCVAQAGGGIDTFGAAVLNRIILQLNFQTRFIGLRGAPEVFVFDGPRPMFEAAMANGNAILGFQIGVEALFPAPAWSGCSHINLALGALFRRPVEDIPSAMGVLGRTRIGCIAVMLDEGDAVAINGDRHQGLEAFFGSDTFVVLVGSAGRVLKAAAHLEADHHKARIAMRIYNTDDGEQRAVMVASGITQMPKLDI